MIVSGLTLVSRIMGFARDLVVTYYMGASATFVADAYTTAFAFPNLFRRIFGEGAFSNAFVPAYSKALTRDGEEVADVLAADAMAFYTMSLTSHCITKRRTVTSTLTLICHLKIKLIQQLKKNDSFYLDINFDSSKPYYEIVRL